MKTPLVYVARHGTTILNDENKFRGPKNPPLDEKGLHDAEELGAFFAPRNIGAIIYSDKARSRQTAETISKDKPCQECVGTPALWAWDVGVFGGQPKSAENVAKLNHYIQNPSLPIPDGESLSAFKQRVRPCIKEAIELANRLGAPILLVAHSSIIHEVGDFITGKTNSCLVLPGGVCEIYTENGRLGARAIFKIDRARIGTAEHADTVS